MATHSSILAWRIPWTVEPDGLQSIGSDMTEQLADTHTHTCSVTQSYLTLCNPMDSSSPGSSAYGIFQARILGWGAISFSRVSS